MTATVSNPPVRRKRGTHVIEWPKLPDDFVLPDDPVENEAQPLLAAALTNALGSIPTATKSALIVSNFALCASVDGRIICKAPDWMYVAPVEASEGIRRSYTPHTEGVIPPVVMEFLSESDCGEYSVQSGRKLGKWYFYEQIIEVPNYVIFDPASGDLEVHILQNGIYDKASATDGRYFIPELDLWLGVWEGTRINYTGYWLRWWTPDGEMVLWSEERAQEAEACAKEAEARVQAVEDENARLLAKLKAAGLE
ncbi:MAG: Uma2 family endonuclease [Phormidesmis sp.]